MAGPIIWAWNDGTYIHIEWDNREHQIERMFVWTAHLGSWVLPVEAFLEEVRTFDSRLIQAMQSRVKQITTDWTRPDIHIDKDQLVLEQADRSKWLEQSLSKVDQERSIDWSAILNAVAYIDAEAKT